MHLLFFFFRYSRIHTKTLLTCSTQTFVVRIWFFKSWNEIRGEHAMRKLRITNLAIFFLLYELPRHRVY